MVELRWLRKFCDSNAVKGCSGEERKRKDIKKCYLQKQNQRENNTHRGGCSQSVYHFDLDAVADVPDSVTFELDLLSSTIWGNRAKNHIAEVAFIGSTTASPWTWFLSSNDAPLMDAL